MGPALHYICFVGQGPRALPGGCGTESASGQGRPPLRVAPTKNASHARRHERRKNRGSTLVYHSMGAFYARPGGGRTASPALPDALSAPLHRAACSRWPPLSWKSCGAYSFRSTRYEIILIIAVFPALVKARQREESRQFWFGLFLRSRRNKAMEKNITTGTSIITRAAVVMLGWYVSMLI